MGNSVCKPARTERNERKRRRKAKRGSGANAPQPDAVTSRSREEVLLEAVTAREDVDVDGMSSDKSVPSDDDASPNIVNTEHVDLHHVSTAMTAAATAMTNAGTAEHIILKPDAMSPLSVVVLDPPRTGAFSSPATTSAASLARARAHYAQAAAPVMQSLNPSPPARPQASAIASSRTTSSRSTATALRPARASPPVRHRPPSPTAPHNATHNDSFENCKDNVNTPTPAVPPRAPLRSPPHGENDSPSRQSSVPHPRRGECREGKSSESGRDTMLAQLLEARQKIAQLETQLQQEEGGGKGARGAAREERVGGPNRAPTARDRKVTADRRRREHALHSFGAEGDAFEGDELGDGCRGVLGDAAAGDHSGGVGVRDGKGALHPRSVVGDDFASSDDDESSGDDVAVRDSRRSRSARRKAQGGWRGGDARPRARPSLSPPRTRKRRAGTSTASESGESDARGEVELRRGRERESRSSHSRALEKAENGGGPKAESDASSGGGADGARKDEGEGATEKAPVGSTIGAEALPSAPTRGKGREEKGKGETAQTEPAVPPKKKLIVRQTARTRAAHAAVKAAAIARKNGGCTSTQCSTATLPSVGVSGGGGGVGSSSAAAPAEKSGASLPFVSSAPVRSRSVSVGAGARQEAHPSRNSASAEPLPRSAGTASRGCLGEKLLAEDAGVSDAPRTTTPHVEQSQLPIAPSTHGVAPHAQPDDDDDDAVPTTGADRGTATSAAGHHQVPSKATTAAWPKTVQPVPPPTGGSMSGGGLFSRHVDGGLDVGRTPEMAKFAFEGSGAKTSVSTSLNKISLPKGDMPSAAHPLPSTLTSSFSASRLVGGLSTTTSTAGQPLSTFSFGGGTGGSALEFGFGRVSEAPGAGFAATNARATPAAHGTQTSLSAPCAPRDSLTAAQGGGGGEDGQPTSGSWLSSSWGRRLVCDLGGRPLAAAPVDPAPRHPALVAAEQAHAATLSQLAVAVGQQSDAMTSRGTARGGSVGVELSITEDGIGSGGIAPTSNAYRRGDQKAQSPRDALQARRMETRAAAASLASALAVNRGKDNTCTPPHGAPRDLGASDVPSPELIICATSPSITASPITHRHRSASVGHGSAHQSRHASAGGQSRSSAAAHPSHHSRHPPHEDVYSQRSNRRVEAHEGEDGGHAHRHARHHREDKTSREKRHRSSRHRHGERMHSTKDRRGSAVALLTGDEDGGAAIHTTWDGSSARRPLATMNNNAQNQRSVPWGDASSHAKKTVDCAARWTEGHDRSAPKLGGVRLVGSLDALMRKNEPPCVLEGDADGISHPPAFNSTRTQRGGGALPAPRVGGVSLLANLR